MPSSAHSPQRPMLAACLVAFAVLAVPFAGTAQSESTRIAVVNLDYVVAKSPAGQELSQKLTAFQNEVRSEAQSMQEGLVALGQQISTGASSLSAAKLAELRKQYEDAKIALDRFADDKDREGKKMQADGLREVEKQLEPVFKAIHDEGGYDLILNNVPGVIVMVGERVEITQEVLDRLKAGS